MVDIDEYLKLRNRPTGPPAIYQKWHDLSFLHFATDPAEIQKLIPQELSIDTFPDESGQEKAWIGLVPFWMSDIRLRKLPAIRGLSSFPETNVRTYVHHKGKQPGVWFFSLEAANAIACAWARCFFGLPYHHATMLVIDTHKPRADGSSFDLKDYVTKRKRDKDAECIAAIQVLDPLPAPAPGSLEFFLIERYLLYAVRNGKLFTGQVHHEPYPLFSARQQVLRETLLARSGIEAQPFTRLHYSPGVDVEVFGLQEVKN